MLMMKIAVYKSTVMHMATMSMKGTVYAQKFNSGVVSEPEKWYHRWCKDFKHRLKLGKGKKLEMARDQCRVNARESRHTLPHSV